ncbi:MAG: SRPBCC family protein [Solirubrobacterales bacterium]|nr:SRPBCC family protein [Solirubrobacterales bacterium]
MGSVEAAKTFEGTVHEAEACWYDTSCWGHWVEGLAEVVSVQGRWPEVGASVTWRSGPAGRGQVREQVVAYEPLEGQTVEVEDDSIRGRQSVAFIPASDGVEVQLSLTYELKKRSLFSPVVDWLFIRRAFGTSLQATLTRFGAELATHRTILG